MGRTVLKKLNSSKGASITFALLAFLVCAVISAVLLAAGMASAGRLSGLAEADRRYYAVTSAAQLFCDSLKADVQEIKIQRIAQLEEEDTYQYIAASKETRHTYSSTETPSMKLLIGSDPVLEMGKNDGLSRITNLRKTGLLTDATLTYLIGKDVDWESSSLTVVEFLKDRPSLIRDGDGTDPTEVLNTWTITVGGPDTDCLSVTGAATMYEDGRIEVDFSNAPEDGKTFTVRVTLNPVLSAEKMTGTPGSWVPDDLNDDITQKFTRSSETTRTVSISWAVSNIKKVS